MAREFPHAKVHGVDLVPAFQTHVRPAPVDGTSPQGAQEDGGNDGIPPNCTFEIDDVNRGLDHFANSFDLVHVRGIAIGVGAFFSSPLFLILPLHDVRRPSSLLNEFSLMHLLFLIFR
jgi:hypothetical protein